MKNFLTLMALVVAFLGVLSASPARAEIGANSCCEVTAACCEPASACCDGAVQGLKQAAAGTGITSASKTAAKTGGADQAADCCPGPCCEEAAACCG